LRACNCSGIEQLRGFSINELGGYQVKVVIFIEIGDKQLNWEDCLESEQKDIGLILNKQGLSALGYSNKEI